MGLLVRRSSLTGPRTLGDATISPGSEMLEVESTLEIWDSSENMRVYKENIPNSTEEY